MYNNMFRFKILNTEGNATAVSLVVLQSRSYQVSFVEYELLLDSGDYPSMYGSKTRSSFLLFALGNRTDESAEHFLQPCDSGEDSDSDGSDSSWASLAEFSKGSGAVSGLTASGTRSKTSIQVSMPSNVKLFSAAATR